MTAARRGKAIEAPRPHDSDMTADPLGRRILAEIREVLAHHAAVDAAYVLGSAAAGRLRPDSDIDIAVLPVRGRSFTVMERLSLAAELGRILARPVDLGVLTTANVVHAKETVTNGRLIFDRHHPTTARFAMLTLSMYAALQEARREVLRWVVESTLATGAWCRLPICTYRVGHMPGAGGRAQRPKKIPKP